MKSIAMSMLMALVSLHASAEACSIQDSIEGTHQYCAVPGKLCDSASGYEATALNPYSDIRTCTKIEGLEFYPSIPGNKCAKGYAATDLNPFSGYKICVKL